MSDVDNSVSGAGGPVVEQAIWGKFVTEAGGPASASSKIGIIAASPGFPKDAQSVRSQIMGPGAADLKIDAAFQSKGALVFKSNQDGLFAARIRLRSEDGKGGNTRNFVLARIFFLKGISNWSMVPPGFFVFCEKALICEPPISGDNPELPRLTFPDIDLSRFFAELGDYAMSDNMVGNRFLALNMAVEEKGKATMFPFSPLESNGGASWQVKELEAIARIQEDDDRKVSGLNPVSIVVGMKPGNIAGAISISSTARKSTYPDTSQQMRMPLIKLTTPDSDLETLPSQGWPVDRHNRKIGIDLIDLKNLGAASAQGANPIPNSDN